MMKHYPDESYGIQRAASHCLDKQALSGFCRAERQNKSIWSPASWTSFGSLILLQDVEEEKISPKWLGSQTDCCMLFYLFQKKTQGIYHDIWRTHEFSVRWRYVNIWHIALKTRSFGRALKTSKWHWHSCFKVTLSLKQDPSTVLIWSCHNLLLTCLGCSLFREAWIRPGFQVK